MPCVFETPSSLTPALCEFFNVSHDTKLSQNAVTHKIHGYCKINKLLEDHDQRIIHPDDKLNALLSPRPDDVVLTFFNIQRYLKHNYLR